MYSSKTQDGYPINVPLSFHGYNIMKYLGCGSTCVVALVEQEKTHTKYSAKIMSKKDIENRNLIDSITREIKILKELNHPHIIKVQETFEIQTDNDDYYVIIMEYCSNGDLLSYATNQGFKNEKEKKRIIYEFLDAIKYLHKKGISHGDIKSENVLLDSKFSAKLCDFGFCRTNSIEGDESKKGTLYYAAPELFVRGEFDPKKTDIWAIGITLYSLFELQFPFKDGNQNFIVKQITSGKLSMSKNLDPKIRKIVEDCTQVKANCRPTIENILDEEYFREIQIQKKIGINFNLKNNNFLNDRNLFEEKQKQKVIDWKPVKIYA